MALGDVVKNYILRMQTKGVTQAKTGVKGLHSNVSHLSLGWGSMGTAATAATGAAVAGLAAMTAAVVGAGVALKNTGAQAEGYRLRLETVLQSQTKANKLFDQLVEFGQRTPFELPGLIETATWLESFEINSIEHLDTIGNAAAAMGQDITQTAMAVTQGMFGEMEQLKKFAITATEIQAELGHGIDRSTKEGRTEVFDAIIAIMERRFEGGMDRMSKSWDGMVSNMLDNWFKLKLEVADGGFFETLRQDLADTLALVDRFASEGGFEAISVGFNNAFIAIHKSFFQPVFDGFDDIEIKSAEIAAAVQLNMMKAALATGKLFESIPLAWQQFLTIPGGIAALATGDLGLIKDKWSEVLALDGSQLRANMDEAKQGVQFLREEVERLELAMEIVSGEKPVSALQYERALNVLDDMGLLLVNNREKITGVRSDLERMKHALDDLGNSAFDGPLFTIESFFPEWVETTAEEEAADIGEKAGTAAAESFKDAWARLFGQGGNKLLDELDIKVKPIDANIFKKAFGQPDSEDVNEFGQPNKLPGFEDLGEEYQRYVDTRMAGIDMMSEAEIDTARLIDATWRQSFSRMGQYSTAFTKHGVNMGRVLNAALVRGAGEVAKATIDAIVARTRVKAAESLADAAALFAQGNYAGAAAMLGAAAKYGAISGIAGIATGYIENQVSQRERDIGGDEGFGDAPFNAGSSVSTARSSRGRSTANTVRTGPQVIYITATVTNNIGGDYNTYEGQPTSAEQLQRMIEEGIIAA